MRSQELMPTSRVALYPLRIVAGAARIGAIFLLASTSTFKAAACWNEAALRYGVAAELLHAIATVESNLDPKAINRSHLGRTNSYDIGLMQVNSSHLPVLERMGITEGGLIEPCTNIMVGAWLLADSLSRHGMTWDGVGAYNAACSKLVGAACTAARSRYAWKVYRQLQAARERSAKGNP